MGLYDSSREFLSPRYADVLQLPPRFIGEFCAAFIVHAEAAKARNSAMEAFHNLPKLNRDLDQISKDAIKIERAKARVRWDSTFTPFYNTLRALQPYLDKIAKRQSQKVEDIIFKADIVAAMHDWSNSSYCGHVSKSLSEDIVALGAHRIASRFFLGGPPA